MPYKKVICYGELVVDCFGSIEEGFVPKFGGAPGNTAVGLARLGHPRVEFVGKVGDDFFGEFLDQTMRNEAVDTRHLVHARGARTTLAFVALSRNGQRDFSFFSGAHDQITPAEVRGVNFTGAAVMQFGSLTQGTRVAAAATQLMLRKATQAHVLKSYDPNVRLPLWPKPAVLKKIILATIPQVNMLKVNEEELQFLTGTKNPNAGSQRLWRNNLQLMIVTLGAKGAFWKTRTGSGMIPVPRVKAIDTTGAGDAFNAGLLFQLEPHVVRGKIELSDTEIADKVAFATRVAAMSTLKKGAIAGLPSLKQVRGFKAR